MNFLCDDKNMKLETGSDGTLESQTCDGSQANVHNRHTRFLSMPFVNQDVSSVLEQNDPSVRSAPLMDQRPSSGRFGLSTRSSSSDLFENEEETAGYDWREYTPEKKSCWNWFRWFVLGSAQTPESDEHFHAALAKLAQCLTLLRKYRTKYGLPERGGPRDQEFVLRNVVIDLYAGGAPLWALEEVIQKASEGLTGSKNINWFILPRKAFVCSLSSGTTNMFTIRRGFSISKLSDMEKVAVRLASFASNTKGVSNVPSRFPSPSELRVASQVDSALAMGVDVESAEPDSDHEKHLLARRILSLASEASGVYFFLNSQEYSEENVDPFWVVTEPERELFSRLAAIEAMQMIDRIDENEKQLYSPTTIVLFRMLASAGACAFWFNGSWIDMLVSAVLAVIVAFIGEIRLLTKQERIVLEVVASFVVGLSAGLIAFKWPDHTCFSAMALAGVLDIFQGYRVVYAVIELMSKHTVAGGADLLEGIMFTFLISTFLRFGENVSATIMGEPTDAQFQQCTKGIDPRYYIFLVPLAACSWSGIFNPYYSDLVAMTFHGCLAYFVNYFISRTSVSEELNNFVSMFCVSVSSSIYSRFSGRSAVGNSIAGIYVLLPGAYLVASLFSVSVDSNFLLEVIHKSTIIGLGAWTGTVICSPTLLGTTLGLLAQQSQSHLNKGVGESSFGHGAMLFF